MSLGCTWKGINFRLTHQCFPLLEFKLASLDSLQGCIQMFYATVISDGGKKANVSWFYMEGNEF